MTKSKPERHGMKCETGVRATRKRTGLSGEKTSRPISFYGSNSVGTKVTQEQVRSDDLGKWQVFGYQAEVAEQVKMGLWHHSLLAKEHPKKRHAI